MASGIGELEAKLDICRAIFDRAIKFRFRVIKGFLPPGKNVGAENVAGTIRDSSCVEIPRDLNPSNFEWQQSRPLIPFQAIGPGYYIPEFWEVDQLELNRQDVTNELLGNPAPASHSDSLKRATDKIIRSMIEDVYNYAEAAGGKPPNIKELPATILPISEHWPI